MSESVTYWTSVLAVMVRIAAQIGAVHTNTSLQRCSHAI